MVYEDLSDETAIGPAWSRAGMPGKNGVAGVDSLVEYEDRRFSKPGTSLDPMSERSWTIPGRPVCKGTNMAG